MGWFFVVALLLSLIIALYLGCRTFVLFNQNETGYFNSPNKKIVWAIILFASFSFIVSRITIPISDYWFPLIGNIVFSLVICLFYSIILIDLIKLFRYIILRKPTANYLLLQSLFLIFAALILGIGLFSATDARTINYQIHIDKPAKVEKLRIVQLSDIHINEMTSPHFIRKIVEQTNKLKPDYIVVTGDTLDMRLKPYLEKNLPEIFSQLNPKYRTFIIFGNHEHYGIHREMDNTEEQVIRAFEDSKMKVLKDSTFYDLRTGINFIGRDDLVIETFGLKREDLSSLVSFSKKNRPIILLDHQPKDLSEPAELGVDLMFSGHTHAGQIFPITLLVQWMYPNAWGVYHNKNGHDFTSIVSSGYGLWGPPLRLMSKAEIVVTDVTFN